MLKSAMGERTDGTWAAKRVGLSVPRQNGKSQLLVARALAGALLFGELKIVVSAHQQDTSRESFTKLLEIIEADGNDKLRSRLRPNGIMQALNREAVRFANGATIQFKARSGPGGRGFSSDCLLLDEAQILSQRAWVSINSTMSAMPNPQVWLLGTPPTPEDDGAVFGSVRESAIAGKSSSAAWLEWAAALGDDPTSELTRWAANPAWNTRINHEVVQGEYETYPADRFALDRLGIWATLDENATSPFEADWSNTATPGPIDGTAPTAMAVDKWHDGTTAICGVWRNDEGEYHGEVLASQFVHDNAGVIDWLVERAGKKITVAIAGDSEAAAMIGDLRARGVKVNALSVADQGRASVGLLADIAAGSMTHAGQELLNDAIAAVRKAPIGKSELWRIGRASPESNVTPAAALAWARFAASVTKIRKRTGQSVFR